MDINESIGYDSVRQLQGYRLQLSFAGSIAGLAATKILGENILRQCLYVWSNDTGNSMQLFPNRPTVIAVDATHTIQIPLVIHAAVYPLLCQGEWWIVPSNTAIIYVYELIQLQN